MTKTKLTQIALLAAAFIIGVTTPAFNGLSLLALAMVGTVAWLSLGRSATAARPASAE